MQKKCILDIFGHYFLNKMTQAEKKRHKVNEGK